MIEEFALFEEKQYLGHNRASIVVRMVLATFCFIAYYWSENPNPVDVSGIRIGSFPVENVERSGRFFFLLGFFVLLLSVLLIYVLHIHTRVYSRYITIDGFWHSRKVKIDLRNIHTVKKMRYKKSLLRRPVYNLHINGIIKFFTSGDEFVELKDKDGLTYRIGSQKATELAKTINKQLNNF